MNQLNCFILALHASVQELMRVNYESSSMAMSAFMQQSRILSNINEDLPRNKSLHLKITNCIAILNKEIEELHEYQDCHNVAHICELVIHVSDEIKGSIT